MDALTPPHSLASPPRGSVCPLPDKQSFEALAIPELIARYRVGVENFDRRVFQLTGEQLDTAFRPEVGVGRWPVRVLLGHLADAELPFVHRCRKAVAEANPMFCNWDEEAFIDSGLYNAQPIGAAIAVIHTVRLWAAGWFESLAPDDWNRRGLHSVRGEQTVRGMMWYYTWHLENHASYLNRKVERMLGPRAEIESKSTGRCGPGCACH
ncbi:MAG: DinB family protein [Phycisphaerales bacterium]|nr:DinB family protein [Phycisphaerales bacterium]